MWGRWEDSSLEWHAEVTAIHGGCVGLANHPSAVIVIKTGSGKTYQWMLNLGEGLIMRRLSAWSEVSSSRLPISCKAVVDESDNASTR